MNISKVKGIGKATIAKLNTLEISKTEDLQKMTWQEISQIKYLKNKQVSALSQYTKNTATPEEIEIYRYSLPKVKVPKTTPDTPNSPTPKIKPRKPQPLSIYDFEDQIRNNIVKASEMELKLVYIPNFKNLMNQVSPRLFFGLEENGKALDYEYNNYFGQFISSFDPKDNYTDKQIIFIKKNLSKFWKVLAYQIILNKEDVKCDNCNNETMNIFTKPENKNLCSDCTENYIDECLSKNITGSFDPTDKDSISFLIDMHQESEAKWKAKQEEEAEERKKVLTERKVQKEYQKTAQENKVEKLVATGKYELCGRCLGSGRYSWNRRDRDVCYGCDGEGVVPVKKDD